MYWTLDSWDSSPFFKHFSGFEFFLLPRIVTDSACDLPEAIVSQHSIAVIPQMINVGDKSFLDGVDLTRSNLFTELTARGLEVLTLIARGFTYQKISEDLLLSIGAVKGHVSYILSKLHLTDHAQAAVYTWQEGIARRE